MGLSSLIIIVLLPQTISSFASSLGAISDKLLQAWELVRGYKTLENGFGCMRLQYQQH